MNKHIKNPFIVNFIKATDDRAVMRHGTRVYIPTNSPWSEFKNAMAPITGDTCDSVIVHVDGNVELNKKGEVQNIDIKMNQIVKFANEHDKPVLNRCVNDVWYILNPSWDDQKTASGYAPSDDIIMEKFNSYGDNFAWQKHQSQIWSRIADMMPLAEGNFPGSPNHIKTLTSNNRGLEKQDLDGFFSWKSNKVLTPSLMGDDMVGMPGIVGADYDGFTITPTKDGVQGISTPILVRSLKTIGMSGIAIPMANAEGNVPKYQIATDTSVINVALKARATDGISIQKSEYFNKKSNEYMFEINGQPSHLKCVQASADGKNNITFQDINGQFNVSMKDDIKDLLVQRGYDIHPLIDSLRVTPNAKYIWQSKGTMIGSEKVAKTVSPSNAGFITAREPRNGKDNYVVLVVEGALKGHIVAKYADVVDKNGQSFGDYIAKDSGIIVAQVPGVSKAFVESVKPIYTQYNVKGTYIGMDADGRDNLSVAKGIATAEKTLSEKSPVRVMSWDPKQKGLDDALLAIAQGKITMNDMDLRFGSAEKLFPESQAAAPNPYKLDGSRVNKLGWQVEYTRDNNTTNNKIKQIQEATKQRAKDLLTNGDELANSLPKADEQQNVIT